MLRQFLSTSWNEEDRHRLADVLRMETTGGLLMFAATVIALLWANLSPDSYLALGHLALGPMTLAHWVMDGLLTIFFFVAGLELKRELTEGSLAKPQHALIPIVAAVGGMAIPAGLYVLLNLAPGGRPEGWAIPMATDIAFALGVLALVGSALPDNLRAFLLTLAIVDDIGSILVIAVFKSQHIDLLWLAGSLAILALWWVLQRRHVDAGWLYALLLFAAWWCMHSSGVHATIAGVLAGLATRSSVAETDPVNRWDNAIRPWSAGLVVPLFALFSAGVHIRPADLRALVLTPVPLGILVGLLAGKLLGVFAAANLTARVTHTDIRPARWREVAGVAQLCGIGFTVSILMVELTFRGQAQLIGEAKLAVLVASLLSGIMGGLFLRRRNTVRLSASHHPEAVGSVD